MVCAHAWCARMHACTHAYMHIHLTASSSLPREPFTMVLRSVKTSTHSSSAAITLVTTPRDSCPTRPARPAMWAYLHACVCVHVCRACVHVCVEHVCRACVCMCAEHVCMCVEHVGRPCVPHPPRMAPHGPAWPYSRIVCHVAMWAYCVPCGRILVLCAMWACGRTRVYPLYACMHGVHVCMHVCMYACVPCGPTRLLGLDVAAGRACTRGSRRGSRGRGLPTCN